VAEEGFCGRAGVRERGIVKAEDFDRIPGG